MAMARAEASPRVRLNLASALQRIPIKDRWPLAEPLAEAAIDPRRPDAAAHDLVRHRAAGGDRTRLAPRRWRRAARPRSSAITWPVAP